MMRVATTVAALLLFASCGGSESPNPATTTTTARPSPTAAPTTLPPAPTTSPSTLPAATSPEEARRILQEHGINPDELSKQIGEQMRKRFQEQPAN